MQIYIAQKKNGENISCARYIMEEISSSTFLWNPESSFFKKNKNKKKPNSSLSEAVASLPY